MLIRYPQVEVPAGEWNPAWGWADLDPSSGIYLPKPLPRVDIGKWVPLSTITLVGVASTPVDNTANAAAPVTVTPPGSMLDGDLVYVFTTKRTASLTLTVATKGGQLWFSNTQRSTTNLSTRSHWCRYNGNWRVNPTFTRSGADSSTPFQAVMMVFRPSGIGSLTTWAVDVAEAYATFTATGATKTVTGQTTSHANTVTIASWGMIAGNVTMSGLSGTGWSQSGLSAQYRDPAGSGMTTAHAYKIQTSAGATGNVSLTESVANAGADHIITFYEIVNDHALPDASPVASGTGTTGNLSSGAQTVPSIAGRVSFLHIWQVNQSGTGSIPTQPTTPAGWNLIATGTILVVSTNFVGRGTVFWSTAPGTSVAATLGNQSVFAWEWHEMTNLATASPIGVNASTAVDNVTSWSVSLPGIGARSACISWGGCPTPLSCDVRANWTAIDGQADGSNFSTTNAFISTGETTASMSSTFGSAGAAVFIAAELKIPTAPPPQNQNRMPRALLVQ